MECRLPNNEASPKCQQIAITHATIGSGSAIRDPHLEKVKGIHFTSAGGKGRGDVEMFNFGRCTLGRAYSLRDCLSYFPRHGKMENPSIGGRGQEHVR